MTKVILIILLVLPFLFLNYGEAGTKNPSNLNLSPTPVGQSLIYNLSLEKSVVRKPCSDCENSDECSDDMTINVMAHKFDDKDDLFEYKVSGGRIIGEGELVKWDLSGLETGSYTISVIIRHNKRKIISLIQK